MLGAAVRAVLCCAALCSACDSSTTVRVDQPLTERPLARDVRSELRETVTVTLSEADAALREIADPAERVAARNAAYRDALDELRTRSRGDEGALTEASIDLRNRLMGTDDAAVDAEAAIAAAVDRGAYFHPTEHDLAANVLLEREHAAYRFDEDPSHVDLPAGASPVSPEADSFMAVRCE